MHMSVSASVCTCTWMYLHLMVTAVSGSCGWLHLARWGDHVRLGQAKELPAVSAVPISRADDARSNVVTYGPASGATDWFHYFPSHHHERQGWFRSQSHRSARAMFITSISIDGYGG
jgi:hypothetical protein